MKYIIQFLKSISNSRIWSILQAGFRDFIQSQRKYILLTFPIDFDRNKYCTK